MKKSLDGYTEEVHCLNGWSWSRHKTSDDCPLQLARGDEHLFDMDFSISTVADFLLQSGLFTEDEVEYATGVSFKGTYNHKPCGFGA